MEKINFDENWKFFYGDIENGFLPDFDDGFWRIVDLPHDFSIELPRRPDSPSRRDGGYFQTGIGWYRKRFFVPEEYKEKKVIIEFDGIYMNSHVWVNGFFVGERPNGYISFYYDITEYLKFGSENVIAVRVDNSKQPNSRWYSGSGIYRHVWLSIIERLHIDYRGIYITTPSVSKEKAEILIKILIENEEKKDFLIWLNFKIIDPYGNEVCEKKENLEINENKKIEISESFIIEKPYLWSAETPFIYKNIIEIGSDKKIFDRRETNFGIRSIEISGDGLKINGKVIKLKGACIHHDNGILGATSYDRAEERKVEILKRNGFNAVRTAHNPPSPSFLDACDKLGLYVIDEAFDVWKKPKLPFDYSNYFENWWKKDLEDMIYRDRNHPSIIIWSIGNEVVERNLPEGVEIAKNLISTVKKIDNTRPVTCAVCGFKGDWSEADGLFDLLDICGYNYQRDNYRKDHERKPERIIVATESFPLFAFDYWLDVLELPYVIGDFVWTGIDYLGEAGIGYARFEGDNLPENYSYPWHQANCGDIDICGFKRPQSFYRDILWKEEPQVYIFVHHPLSNGKYKDISGWGWYSVFQSWTWNGFEGKELVVDIYSNCDYVELFLNGNSLGIKEILKETKFIATYKVPYQKGNLKAIGYKDNKIVCEDNLFTADKPYKIILTPDREKISSKKGDLCYIVCEVVDKNGIINPEADNIIEFSIKGKGVIEAVGNSNPLSEESYRGNKRKVYLGKCLLIVKSTGSKGKIEITGKSDGLKSGKTIIYAE